MERIVVQSSRDSMNLVEGFISTICDSYHVGNHFATISVAVMHAVENAIVHGNRLCADKNTVITCGHCKGGIYFEVEDEGPGFDYAKYGDFPIGKEGEGVFLMKTLADRLVFSKEGRKVRMEFDINGIEASDSMERRMILERFSALESVEI